MKAESGIPNGTVLDGKYRVEGIIGRGGMGTVYRALHLALNEPVAMKILRPETAADEEVVTRFMREAQWAAKLRSEHIARVHDVGQTGDGLPFMVMEFLQGADLGQLVDQNGSMHPPIAVDLVLQACDAIAEAHSLGIVHRDIKPTNLYVSFRPDETAIVKVLDFGISKASGGTDLSLTQTQSMLGTPAYMSPEQMRSARDVDQRTDIWSLGTVLYELVEARRPFQAESFSEMCVMVAVDPPQPMTIASDLEAVILKCLEKVPNQRYSNVAELMAELAPFANNQDAARYYVTRAQRVLGRESYGSIHRGSTPNIGSPIAAPIITPPPLPIAALTMHKPGLAKAVPLSTTATTMGPTRVDAPLDLRRGRRGVWIGALAALVLGVGGAVAYVRVIDKDPERADASKRTTVTEPTNPEVKMSVVDPPVVDPPAIDAAVVEIDAGTGSATQTATIEKPAIKKPPIKKPPIKKPPVVAKPPDKKPPLIVKPKCDPFDSRVKC